MQLPADPRINELAVLRKQQRCRHLRSCEERVLLRRDAEQPTLHAAADQAARPAALQGDAFDVMAEFVDFFAEVVHRFDPLLVAHDAAERPAGVERIERPLGRDAVAVAVARVREHGAQAHAAVEHVRVAVAQERLVAVDVARIGDRELLAGAEQVAVGEPHAPFVLAAAAGELQIGCERPRVANADVDLDRVRLRVVRSRRDSCVGEKTARAERARGFVEQASRVAVADLEQ